MPQGTIEINRCIPAAHFYANVALYERRLYGTTPSYAISKIMQCCAKLSEATRSEYLSRVQWPMFIAAMETDDMVYQAWILDRFIAMQRCGENLRRATVFIKAVLAEQRQTGIRVNYMSWLRDGPFQKFVL